MIANRWGIISVGADRHQCPREFWGPRDWEAERLEMAAIESPLPHAPGGAPPPLKFSLFPTPVIGGVRSRAVDELVAKYTGRR
jgi:hypothetical protein